MVNIMTDPTPPTSPAGELRAEIAKIVREPDEVGIYKPSGQAEIIKSFSKTEAIEAIISREVQAAVREGASIAAQEINREIGTELTLDGRYYLDRHGRKEQP